jgi:hypothetical protein
MTRPLPPDIVEQIDRGFASPDPKARLHAGILHQSLIINEGPERAWPLVVRWGTTENEDIRKLIASWALWPLLDKHYDKYFPLAEQLALDNPFFAEALLSCFANIYGSRREEQLKSVRRRLLDAGVKPWLELSEATLDDILDEEDLDLFADSLRDHLLGRDEPSTAEAAALRVLMFALEVPEGGFRQFFWNSAGDEARETVTALNRIGAPAIAHLLEEANSAFGSAGPATAFTDRRQQIDALGEPAYRAWRALDDAYYKTAGDLIGLLREYIRTRRREFGG